MLKDAGADDGADGRGPADGGPDGGGSDDGGDGGSTDRRVADDGARPSVTIRDVAREAKVHISTVSRALDPRKRSMIGEATRERVLAVVDELGYQPHLVASGLRRGQTRTVGVVVPDLGNPIFAPFARGATHALGGAGYMPLVADTEDDHTILARILRHLAERRVDAIIMTAARLQDEPLLLAIAEGGVPVVTAIRTLPTSGLPTVFHDDRAGGRLAARHLLDLGHERLGQVRGPTDVEPFLARGEAFAAEVRAAGAALVADRSPASRPTVEEGRRIATELLAGTGSPTALFVQNDTMAIGALLAVRELGLHCPDDVSIVGYNDGPFAAHTDPPLSTIRLAPYEIGRQAGLLALEAIEHRGDNVEAYVDPELIVRRSSAPPTH
jgi:LacI family transcriptional regulator